MSQLSLQPSNTRVVVIDDHPAMREALAAMVEASPDLTLCGLTGTAEQTFPMMARERPDVAVVDITLPDAHGLDLVQNLLSIYPDLRMVVYTVCDERIYAESALRVGALGYVMKIESSQVLQEAIRCVARGDIYLSRAMSSMILSRSAGKPRQGSSTPTDLLTDRETAVLQLLGQGCSVDDISKRLHICRKTVETHRRHVKEKLDLSTVSELLVFAVRWTDARPAMRQPRADPQEPVERASIRQSPSPGPRHPRELYGESKSGPR